MLSQKRVPYATIIRQGIVKIWDFDNDWKPDIEQYDLHGNRISSISSYDMKKQQDPLANRKPPFAR